MAKSISLLSPGEFTPRDVTFGITNGHIVVADSRGRSCDLGSKVTSTVDGEMIEVTVEELRDYLNSHEFHEELMGAADTGDQLQLF